MEIADLEAQILYYASKYYSGEPEISDELFDKLVEQLREINPNSSVLRTGWGFEVMEDKVKHKYSHIGSLDKCKSFDTIPSMFKDTMVYISPKLDGLSAVAYYERGRLVKGITRGNGDIGKDITEKLKMIIGTEINDKQFTGAVRGELIINNDNWQILNEKYSGLISARNFSAGIINRKEIDEDIQYLDLVLYKITGQEGGNILHRRDDILKWLAFNFKCVVPEYYYPTLNEASWEAFHETTFEQFKTLGYCLDGLVLTLPDVKYNNNTQGYVYTEVAFKFQAESTTTIIKNIEWALSRTQRYVPVAVVEPVELSGAVVERATCNNAQWVKDMKLGKGAEVEICRSNEVIPAILSVLQPSDEQLPKYCPACKQELVWDGVDLKCNNENCPNIRLSDLQQWCENVGETDGLQWTLMKQYLDAYGVTDIDSLYAKQNFIWNDLSTKKLSITELKVKDFFEKLYYDNVDLEKALVGLNIPRLGEKTAKVLAKRFDVVYQLILMSANTKNYDNQLVKMSLLELVKEATTETILSNIEKFKVLMYLVGVDSNSSRLIYSQMNSNANVRYIAVTGALNTMKRKDFEKYIAEYGYELTGNLKKCEYLVTNTPDSSSTKNKQAKELNIPVITEENFLNKLHKN